MGNEGLGKEQVEGKEEIEGKKGRMKEEEEEGE
jgi:hypothetical protein